uniref:AMP_N domain-containing protein n=1 Tax=Panagrellus redivivus TaxID=6233 RepID=A0A7E4VS56_PANRE
MFQSLPAFLLRSARSSLSYIRFAPHSSSHLAPVMTSNPKLEAFRQLLVDNNLNAYALPSTDAHQSEYLPDHEFRVRFISGFSGSNGFAVITADKALLWTDGRYFAQAEKEFEPGWTLMKEAVPEAISPEDWLGKNLNSGDTVGVDTRLFSYFRGKKFSSTLKSYGLNVTTQERHGRVINLVDDIWTTKPVPEIKTVTTLSLEECGKSTADKLADLRKTLVSKKCGSILLMGLDEIAWLLNIRGFDIPYNPLVYAVLLVTLENEYLFIDQAKLDEEARKHLNLQNIMPYDVAADFLRSYNQNHVKNSPKVFIPDSTNYVLGDLISDEFVFKGASPVLIAKSIKNEVELAGIRDASIRDSAAIIRFLVWLRKELANGTHVTELDAAAKMDAIRAEFDKFVSPSFTTIAAADEHSAFPHYHPTEAEGHQQVRPDSVFLLDSGGHYRDGTTDVTRTVCFAAQPDPYFKKLFTFVTRAHIDNAATIFPDGVNGGRLDVTARQFLWSQGYDFSHGVGHGVGHFLNVHEGPIGIGYRTYSPEAGLHPGQVITIEPGYYEVGKFGIRFENCYEIVKVESTASGATNFLAFESLTWVPIQTDLLELQYLEQKHIDWINQYHATCIAKVQPFLVEHDLTEELAYLDELTVKLTL